MSLTATDTDTPVWRGDSSYPEKMVGIMDRRRAELIKDGHAPTLANEMALRHAQHAGWFRVHDGFKQLGPDVRGKVNVRSATPQPDGRFFIEGVPVFYPNATKAKYRRNFATGMPERDGNHVFTEDDIRRISRNTNKGIKAGGQRPALTPGHPTPGQRDMGINLPSLGSAINFRKSDRGPGWVECDLTDVSPATVADWRNHRITGLSAGFVNDADGMNERFGHIATLGGESQALSHLPITEVFSVGNQLCFSADADTFISEQPNAGVSMNGKEKASKMKDSHSKMASAYDAISAGEPGAGDKLAEAHSSHKSLVAGMEPEMIGDTMIPAEKSGGVAPDESSNTAPGNGTEDVMANSGTYANLEPLNFSAVSVEDFRKDPEQAFMAAQNNFTQQNKQFSAAVTALKDLQKKNQLLNLQTVALKGKLFRTDFDNKVRELQAAGHQFSAEDAGKMFDAAAGNPTIIDNLYNLLKNSPKKASLADIPATFSANGGDTGRAPNPTEVEATLDQLTKDTGKTFSAFDVMAGGGFTWDGSETGRPAAE